MRHVRRHGSGIHNETECAVARNHIAFRERSHGLRRWDGVMASERPKSTHELLRAAFEIWVCHI